MAKLSIEDCLATNYPEIANQWHPTKNGDLAPYNVTSHSGKKVWWKCPKGDDHEWKASISDRTSQKKGCSVCAGRTVVKSNCLATTHPEIAKQWHQTKNGDLTSYGVTHGSHRKVWWKCEKGDDHEWKAFINNRRNHTCPICSGHKSVKSNCLATTHPEITKQWHPTKNKKLTPYDIVSGSNKKVWWKCEKGDDHEWKASIVNRTSQNRGCSVCAGRTVVKSNCLATTHPEITKQWHPTKNKKLTPYDIVSGSDKKVWWKCEKGDDHEWKASIVNRTNNMNGCSVCAGRTVVKSNCLATTHPEIVKEWHPTKNKKLTPYDVVFGSNKKVWWKCSTNESHVWKAPISRIAAGRSGCPRCSESHGEKKISEWLKNKNIEYIREKRFKNCRNKRPLPFDFHIFLLNICIEYDGPHHFNPVIFPSMTVEQAEENFESTKFHDSIKTEFCKTNNIKLLRIPYFEFDNIEKILNDAIPF